MNEGWIKLYRKIEQHWLYPKDREFTEYEAWQDILLQVNHKTKKIRVKNKIFTCKRGESLRSVKQWGKRWKWSKSKVYRFFDLLEQDNMIKTVSETVTTRLTVYNYDGYQENKNGTETQSERKRNDPETVSDTNKNEKNVKNEKKIQPAQENSESDEPQHKPSSLFEVKKFFKNNQATEVEAEMFYYHFEEQGWVKGNGMAIVSWHSAAIKWIKKNVNDSKYQTDYSQKVMDGGTW